MGQCKHISRYGPAFVEVSCIVRIKISETLLLTGNILLEYQTNVYGTFNVL